MDEQNIILQKNSNSSKNCFASAVSSTVTKASDDNVSFHIIRNEFPNLCSWPSKKILVQMKLCWIVSWLDFCGQFSSWFLLTIFPRFSVSRANRTASRNGMKNLVSQGLFAEQLCTQVLGARMNYSEAYHGSKHLSKSGHNSLPQK